MKITTQELATRWMGFEVAGSLFEVAIASAQPWPLKPYEMSKLLKLPSTVNGRYFSFYDVAVIAAYAHCRTIQGYKQNRAARIALQARGLFAANYLHDDDDDGLADKMDYVMAWDNKDRCYGGRVGTDSVDDVDIDAGRFYWFELEVNELLRIYQDGVAWMYKGNPATGELKGNPPEEEFQKNG